MEGPDNPQRKSSLKSEHLKPEVEAIHTRISFSNGGDDWANKVAIIYKDLEEKGEVEFLDYDEKEEELNSAGVKNAGRQTYLISPIDNSSKISRDYLECIALVVCGIDKETGENISFMTHQNPFFSLVRNGAKFEDDLSEKLKELKDRCEEGTIDAVITGGKTSLNADSPTMLGNYQSSVVLLSTLVEETLGFDPVVTVGPKHNIWGFGDTVFFDNKDRILYIIRDSREDKLEPPFEAGEVSNKRHDWEEVRKRLRSYGLNEEIDTSELLG